MSPQFAVKKSVFARISATSAKCAESTIALTFSSSLGSSAVDGAQKGRKSGGELMVSDVCRSCSDEL
jgi:hypothetical protein